MKFGAFKALLIRPKPDKVLNQDHVQGVLRDTVVTLRGIVNDIEVTVDDAIRAHRYPFKPLPNKRVPRAHK